MDKNVNTATIDKYVELEGVEYIDARMLFDSAQFEKIGGQRNLLKTIEGFKVVPWPYIGTLDTMPVEGTYKGDSLFSIKWDADGNIVSEKETVKAKHTIYLDAAGGFGGISITDKKKK